MSIDHCDGCGFVHCICNQEEEAINEEIQLVNAHCFGLIKRASRANAEKMTINQENVTFKGEKIGSWKITVEKIKE